MDRLERAGRIQGPPDGTGGGSDDAEAIVLTGAASAGSGRPEILRREDFKGGSRRGKVRGAVARREAASEEAGLTVEEMAARERGSTRSMDEVYARNVARVGSRYKGNDFAKGSRSGADEEDVGGDIGGADMTMFQSQSERLTGAEAAKRERSRQIVLHDRQSAMTTKCWWWIDSPSFRKHMLLALGDHVSLVLCPSHLALVPHQCMLVPVRHAESFVHCEDEVWEEVRRFQSSLRKMFAERGEGIIFLETVLPDKGFWQARIEVVPVIQRAEQDAPM